MRIKAHQFEVDDRKEAMRNFASLLGKLTKVPKKEMEAMAKRKRKPPRKKAKA